MSSIPNTISFHAVLEHFFKSFTSKDPKPSGIRVANMDGLTIREAVSLQGGYFVSAQKLNMVVSNSIKITGPGGGLIAADKVKLEAPEIDLDGTPEQPIRIVAITDLNIQSQDLKIRNVVVYLFDNANFFIHSDRYPRFENLVIVKVNLVDDQPQGQVVANLRDLDSYKSLCVKIPAKTEAS